MCMGSKAPQIPPPPPPVDMSGPEGYAAAEKQRKQAALAAGRSSTILSGPLGDTSAAPVAKKTLLGA